MLRGRALGPAVSVSQAPLPHHPAPCPCRGPGSLQATSNHTFPSLPRALTNARLGRNPREPQVEDHTPDIEHATDLGGEAGQRPRGVGVGGDRDPKAKYTSPCPQSWHGLRHLGLGHVWVLSLFYPLQCPSGFVGQGGGAAHPLSCPLSGA